MSTLRAYQTLYQQYCNRSSTGKTYQDLYNDIHDLPVRFEGDGIKSSMAKESDMDDSDGSRSTKESSSNSHSSIRNQQIAAAANYLAQQQVASNTAANDTKSSHQARPAAIHQAPGKAPSLHARTARALSTPPTNGARPLSAMNPTAASHSRTPQSARLTMCVSMDSINLMTSNHRQGGSHLSREANNPSRDSSSPRSIASRARTEEKKTMTHASTPRSACRSTAHPSP